MFKIIISITLLFVGFFYKDPTIFFEVKPFSETEPVLSKTDAADDICIWTWGILENETLIIGTDKDAGLEVYLLSGKRINHFPFGRINNIDVVSKDTNRILIAGTNRSFQTIDIYEVFKNGEINRLFYQKLDKGFSDLYGLCAFKMDSKNFVVITDQEEKSLSKFELLGNQLKLVDRIYFKSTCEGIVADVNHNRLLVNEEDIGIWVVTLNDFSKSKKLILETNKKDILPDLEGISIYQKSQYEGLYIFSIQGKNRFGILDRKSMNYLGQFSIIKNNEIDGVQETDGLDISSIPCYANQKGILVVQDGFNKGGNQNFKIISMESILINLAKNL